MVAFNHQRIVFRHMIELSHCECLFCSAEEVISGRTRLYLIFRKPGKIYTRNGMQETWDLVEDQEELQFIRDGFVQALSDRKIPCFMTTTANA